MSWTPLELTENQVMVTGSTAVALAAMIATAGTSPKPGPHPAAIRLEAHGAMREWGAESSVTVPIVLVGSNLGRQGQAVCRPAQTLDLGHSPRCVSAAV